MGLTQPTFSEAGTRAHDPAAEREQRGAILRRLRAGCEAQMTTAFDPILSLVIDKLVEQEEALSQDEEGRP